MKPKTIQQEILLFAGTGFFNGEFYLNDDGSKKTTGYFPMEHLEKACWAGMLFELLPGLVDC